MQKMLGAVVCLATGLGGDLISRATAESTAEAQDKAMKHQVLSTHTVTAAPGSSDGVLLMQAQALIGKLPSTMPGSEHDTPAMVSLGKKLYFEEGISINNSQ